MPYLRMAILRLLKNAIRPNSAEPVEWLTRTLSFGDTVGDWIPPEFESYVRILHPAYVQNDENPSDGTILVSWRKIGEWSGREVSATSNSRELMYRSDGLCWNEVGYEPSQGELENSQLSSLLALLKEETATSDKIWMLLWTGYGGAPDTFGLPVEASDSLSDSGRQYVLRKGSIDTSENETGFYGYENPPSFWWPGDHAWFASCDIDNTSTYVGGSEKLILKILANPVLETFRVDPNDPHNGRYVEDPGNGFHNQTISGFRKIRNFRFGFFRRFGGTRRSSAILQRQKRGRERITPKKLVVVLVIGIAMLAISGMLSSSIRPKSTTTTTRAASISKLISDCTALDQGNINDVGRFADPMCGSRDSELILAREGAVVMGFIRSTSATRATVSRGGPSLDIPITAGHFLFPSRLSGNSGFKFTITFSETGGSVCSYVNVSAPGESSTRECRIS